MENKEFKSFYKKVNGGEGDRCHYPTRLDLYGCGCSHNCSYCLDGDTDVLMYDLSTKKIKDVEVGDEVIGISEGESYKYFTKSIVINRNITRKQSYKITLQNGNVLICSDNHQWLSTRGWKYTIGDETGKNRRPHLKVGQTLMGFYSLFDVPKYENDENYMRGYLRGVILGDGHLKKYDYSGNRREIDTQYHFRLALKNESITKRVKEYLDCFGIETYAFIFPMKDRETKEEFEVTAIRTNKKEDFDKINEIIEKSDNLNFYRGFLAGIYDAEGSTDLLIKRIYNGDNEIIEDTINAFSLFDFKTTKDKDKTTKNLIVKTIRLLGGLSENLRFMQITDCVKREMNSLENIKLKSFNSEDLKIVSIEPLVEQELYDITTTTRNFIANGVVSHNCYAKSLLEFRKLWNNECPSVANIDKVRKRLDKIVKENINNETIVLRLGGMTDCFQPIEKNIRNTLKTIKLLNERGIHYLIVTKSHIVADKEYIEAMDKNLAHIQISITTTDDELGFTYEKASPSSKRIEAIEKLQSEGFDVTLRLSPFIPEYLDFNIVNNINCDKVLIEFLRINTFIKRTFKNLNYDKYTIKYGSYNHLPLDIKKEYLNNITNFKYKSICEDVPEHYDYWKNNYNTNKNDCCNISF